MTWVLIVFIGTSYGVSGFTVPGFKAPDDCEAAGRAVKERMDKWSRDVRTTCVQQ